MIKLDTIPQPNPDIVSKTVDNETVLILPEQGKVKVLNDVGAFIWQLSDGTRTLKEIAVIVSKTFDVELKVAETDTIYFISELSERQLVYIND
jgi:hypothetical protein